MSVVCLPGEGRAMFVQREGQAPRARVIHRCLSCLQPVTVSFVAVEMSGDRSLLLRTC